MMARPRLEISNARWRMSMRKFVRKSAMIFFMMYLRPFNNAGSYLFASKFASGQFEENIFEGGCAYLQVGNCDALLVGVGKQAHQRGLHLISVDDVALVGLAHSADMRQCQQIVFRDSTLQVAVNSRLRAQAANQTGGGVQGDDLATIHDGDAITQDLRLVHVVGGEKNGLALLAQF